MPSDTILIGYLPKRIVDPAGDVDAPRYPGVEEICSVSECFSKSPREGEKYWLHNTDTWLFDGPGSPSFFCSPLSCNGMAAAYPVNRSCLVDDLETAVTMARDFATGNCEPGPYCVVEVWTWGRSGHASARS